MNCESDGGSGLAPGIDALMAETDAQISVHESPAGGNARGRARTISYVLRQSPQRIFDAG
jgi:hypothetical protein